MKLFSVLVLLLFMNIANAQLTIIVDSVPDYTPENAELYFAGDITNWIANDPNYKMEKTGDNEWTLIIPEMAEGTVIQFKITRGSWETVEKGALGEEITNREYSFGNGDTIRPIILNWADNGSGGGESTASENVHILDEAFYMPQLFRNRRIWIYLPSDYESSDMSYAVLYMHDGQNLFDYYTSYAGEWQVDETLDDLKEQGFNVPIVVGIDNGGIHRIDEYTPWINPQYGGGQGSEYIDFIIETLKPHIDSNYRTLSDRENTAIMGSSLGGLISHYGVLNFQEYFSKAGIFSPAYWISDSVWDFTTNNPKEHGIRFYQMCGGEEGIQYINQMNLMNDQLLANGFDESELSVKVIAGGHHNEQLWRDDFETAYKWLFQDYIGATPELKESGKLELFPNPASSFISISDLRIGDNDSIEIFSLDGRVILPKSILKTNDINIESLKTGTYIIVVKSQNKSYSGSFIKM